MTSETKAEASFLPEEHFRLLVDAVKDYAIYALDLKGRVTSWNQGAERSTGYTASEIIGKNFSCFFTEEDIRAGEPEHELQAAAELGQFEREAWRVRKDGSRFWASVLLTAIRDEKGELIGFAKVTRDYTERKLAEELLQRANDELAAEIKERQAAQEELASSEKALRELSLHLLRTQDEERKRIGRELHDSLGQYLIMLKMNLDSLQLALERSPEAITDQVAQCVRLADDSIKEVRTISYLLYPPMLEEVGLKSAIRWYLDGFSERSNIQTAFEVDEDFPRLERHLELALFRILQESLTNVHRHSGSSRANIRLWKQPDWVILEIKDHGKGIPAELFEESGKAGLGSSGVGLRGMHERMRQLRGKLEISSNEGGTLIRASVPLGQAASGPT